MIKSKFLTSTQRAKLEQIVRRPSEDHALPAGDALHRREGVARRANAIFLLDDGWNCERVGEALYLDDDTVRNWPFRRAGPSDHV